MKSLKRSHFQIGIWILSGALILWGSFAQSESSVDLVQLEKSGTLKPIQKPTTKPEASRRPLEFYSSQFWTTFKGDFDSEEQLSSAAEAWVKSLERDTAFRKLCGEFDWFGVNQKPQCFLANQRCLVSVKTQKCQFVHQFGHCPDYFESRYSPDSQHQDFKLCVKMQSSGSTTGSSPTSTSASGAR